MEDGDFSQNRRLDLAVWPAAFIFADFFVFSVIPSLFKSVYPAKSLLALARRLRVERG